MGVKIRFNFRDNPAKIYSAVLNELERIANERGELVQDVIANFIIDLRNLSNSDYERKIEEVDISGETQDRMLSDIIKYLTKAKKTYENKTKREEEKANKETSTKKNKTQELRDKWEEIEAVINDMTSKEPDRLRSDILGGILISINMGSNEFDLNKKQRKYVVRMLEDLLEEAKREERAITNQKARLEAAWDVITQVVERENDDGNFSNLEYWTAIKEEVVKGEETFGVAINGQIRNQLIERIDSKINEERDLLYFEQVEKFTRGFRFLREESEVVRANLGASDVRFTDREVYSRFCGLRDEVQKGEDEYTQILTLLQSDDIDNMSKQILTQRLNILEAEKIKDELYGENDIR